MIWVCKDGKNVLETIRFDHEYHTQYRLETIWLDSKLLQYDTNTFDLNTYKNILRSAVRKISLGFMCLPDPAFTITCHALKNLVNISIIVNDVTIGNEKESRIKTIFQNSAHTVREIYLIDNGCTFLTDLTFPRLKTLTIDIWARDFPLDRFITLIESITTNTNENVFDKIVLRISRYLTRVNYITEATPQIISDLSSYISENFSNRCFSHSLTILNQFFPIQRFKFLDMSLTEASYQHVSRHLELATGQSSNYNAIQYISIWESDVSNLNCLKHIFASYTTERFPHLEGICIRYVDRFTFNVLDPAICLNENDFEIWQQNINVFRNEGLQILTFEQYNQCVNVLTENTWYFEFIPFNGGNRARRTGLWL